MFEAMLCRVVEDCQVWARFAKSCKPLVGLCWASLSQWHVQLAQEMTMFSSRSSGLGEPGAASVNSSTVYPSWQGGCASLILVL